MCRGRVGYIRVRLFGFRRNALATYWPCFLGPSSRGKTPRVRGLEGDVLSLLIRGEWKCLLDWKFAKGDGAFNVQREWRRDKVNTVYHVVGGRRLYGFRQ